MKISEYNDMMAYLTRPPRSEQQEASGEQLAMAGAIKGGKKLIQNLIKKGDVKKGQAPKTDLGKIEKQIETDKRITKELAEDNQIPVKDETIVPEDVITVPEPFKEKYQQEFLAHDALYGRRSGDNKVDAEAIAETVADMQGKVYDDLGYTERMDLYDKAYNYLGLLDRTKGAMKEAKGRTLQAEGGVIGGGMIEGEDLGDRTGFARPSSSARTSKQIAPGIIERTYTSTKGKGTTKTYVAMVKSGGEEIKKTFPTLEEAKKGLEELKIQYPPQYVTPTGGAEAATELQKKFIRRAAKEAGIDRPNFKEYPTRGYSTNNKKGQLVSKSVSKALKRNPNAQTYSELFPLKTKKISRADQNKIKEIFPDADFKKGSYGFSFTEEPRKYDQARRLIFGKDFSTTDYGFNFGKSENWLLTQFDRADYEPIYKKGTYSGKSKIVGFIDPETGTKYYHANYDPELLKLDTNAKLITQHPDADDVIRISDVAREGKYKVPDTLNKLFAKYGRVTPKFNDMLNYVLDKEGYKTANNLIEKHHTKLVKVAPSQAIQLLTKDKNLLAEAHRQKIEAAKDVTEKNKLINEADEVFKKQGIKLDLPTGEKLGIKEIPSPEKYVEDTRKYVERVLLKDVAEKGPSVLEKISSPIKDIPTDKILKNVVSGRQVAANPFMDMIRVAAPSLPAIFGPTGITGLTYALRPEEGYDLSDPLTRIGFEAEAALAPTAVKGTSKAASYLAGSNQPLRRGLERVINLGMRAPTALKIARVASPIGIASLGAEGVYQLYQALENEKARIAAMSPEERQRFEEEQTAAAYMGEAEGYAYGGRVELEEGGPPDPGRRKFFKIMGGLASLPILGKIAKPIAKAGPEAVEVISRTAEQMPTYLTALINKIKNFGKSKVLGKPDSPDGAMEYNLGDYTVIEGPGYTRINKSNYGGFGDEVGIRNEIEMEIKKDPETGTIQYEEIEVYPDMDGKMRDVEEGVDDMFHEEMEKFARSDD